MSVVIWIAFAFIPTLTSKSLTCASVIASISSYWGFSSWILVALCRYEVDRKWNKDLDQQLKAAKAKCLTPRSCATSLILLSCTSIRHTISHSRSVTKHSRQVLATSDARAVKADLSHGVLSHADSVADRLRTRTNHRAPSGRSRLRTACLVHRQARFGQGHLLGWPYSSSEKSASGEPKVKRSSALIDSHCRIQLRSYFLIALYFVAIPCTSTELYLLRGFPADMTLYSMLCHWA